eukprot:6173433-Pleurochrysis_carterae.AAC.5
MPHRTDQCPKLIPKRAATSHKHRCHMINIIYVHEPRWETKAAYDKLHFAGLACSEFGHSSCTFTNITVNTSIEMAETVIDCLQLALRRVSSTDK